jgi:hypothetical protein
MADIAELWGDRMAGGEDGRYEIASVLSRSVDTISSYVLLFAGLALVLSGLPAFVMEYWQASDVRSLPRADASWMFASGYFGPIIAGWLVGIISGAVLQAALTRATVTHLSGDTPDFGRCLTVGLTMILPMIGISIVFALGVGLALVLLVVPGVILWMCWSVVVPVYVQEKVGMFEAFGRSLELTRGWRWRIFLTMLVMMIGLWLLGIPAGMLTVGIAASGSIIASSLVGAAISALASMVMVTVQACIYVELRDVKDGVAPADLEAIFA